jgi:sugar phosphate isomerase/epimerase
VVGGQEGVGGLDDKVPADAEGKVPTGIGFWCTRWPADPAWRFVAVGVSHDVAYWTEFLPALAEIDPDMAVNIEHEDATYSRLDGLARAAENLRAAAKNAVKPPGPHRRARRG